MMRDKSNLKMQGEIICGHKILFTVVQFFSNTTSRQNLSTSTTYSTMTIAIAVQGSTPIIEKSDVVAQPTSKDVSIEKDYWNNF